ncbi:tyrosine-type recombinase/integrase [Pseudomonas germanica]|uniref:hypothetical protein n=1 Tax=Pseudomonas germanica TaxID=2815720 RepID=UPI002A4E19FF|nr:hypothetical protein [Pseudomonas germanica]WPN75494.1 hypothetical protein QMK46_03790 [Pseudomonas germanica]
MVGFLTRWLTGRKKHVSSSTYDGYREIVELRLVPALCTVIMVDLKRKIVRDWLDTLDVINKTFSNIQSCLRSALNDAAEEELIEMNPLGSWTYSRRVTPSKEDNVDPFSLEEQQAVLDALSGQARNMMYVRAMDRSSHK